MDLSKLFSPEMNSALAGALVAFLLTISWQLYMDRRNKVQLTYFKKIESPLTIAINELKEKLQIFYNHNEIKDIFYARLTIKNTGQKTIKNQIFTCTFSENSKILDPKFPLFTMIPEAEIPFRKIPIDESNSFQANVYRYQIDVISPNQAVQIDFLFDGDAKDFKVLFRPNDFDEVKIVERSSSSDPNIEFYIGQFGYDIFIYILLVSIGNFFGIFGGIAVLLGLPFLYNAFTMLKRLIPLLLEINILKNKKPDYEIQIGNGASSNLVIGQGGYINTVPPKNKKGKNK